MRILKFFVLLFFSLLINHPLEAQSEERIHQSSRKGELTFGLGLGLPYGGIGMRFSTNVADHYNMFFGLGYQLAEVGYNIGLRRDIRSFRQTQLYFIGMYGSNAVFVREYGGDGLMFFGISVGTGIKINSKNNPGNYWELGLIKPFRSHKFNQFIEGITDVIKPWPVLITAGYHIKL